MKIKRGLLAISCMACLLLLLPLERTDKLLCAALFLPALAMPLCSAPPQKTGRRLAITLCLAVVLGGKFCLTWSEYGVVQRLLTGLPGEWLLGALGGLLALAAIFFLMECGAWGCVDLAQKRLPLGNQRLTAAEQAGAGAIGLAVMIFCTRSSPLYPFNDWCDPNCFVTVARGWVNGMLPYRDLYEQKGPLLYLLHAGACLISDHSFFGVWLLEIAACLAAILLILRIFALRGWNCRLTMLGVTAALLYFSGVFVSGDTAEELCMPFLLYALLVGVRAAEAERLPGKREGFRIGLTSACVLMIKYTMVGLYLGWFVGIALLFFRLRKGKKLISFALCIAAGVGTAVLPMTLYFAANGALGDLIQVYFLDNILLYTKTQPLPVSLITGLSAALNDGFAMMLPVLAGVALCALQGGAGNGIVVCSFVGLLLGVYGGGRHIPYYA